MRVPVYQHPAHLVLSYDGEMSSPPSLPQHEANPLVADALQRAKALASERQVLKRPSEEYLEGPNQKKYQQAMDMNFAGGPGMTSEQVMVPDNMVGLIIGRGGEQITNCLLYTSPSPRDGLLSRMPSSA